MSVAAMSAIAPMDLGLLETIDCELCGCKEHSLLFQKRENRNWWIEKCNDDERLDREFPFSVVKCKDCGIAYVNPRLKPDLIASIYANYWRSEQPQQPVGSLYANYLCRQLAVLGRTGRLLDFGCGWGDHLAAATSLGWDAMGVEVDQVKVDFCNKHRLKAVFGNLLDGLFEEASFDAVIAEQVFEHLYDPASYLKEVRRVLKPGGVLYIAVPNFDGLLAKLQGPSWDLVHPVCHVRYFDSSTLSRFLATNGFSVLEKAYLPRYGTNTTKNTLYWGKIFAENNLGIYPKSLSVFAKKVERSAMGEAGVTR